MTKLWGLINESKLKIDNKNKLFLLIMIIVDGILGGLGWLLFVQKLLSGITWFICFIGYPALIFGFFRGVLYLYNHEFK